MTRRLALAALVALAAPACSGSESQRSGPGDDDEQPAAPAGPRVETFTETVELMSPERLVVELTVAVDVQVAGDVPAGDRTWYEQTVQAEVRQQTKNVIGAVDVARLEPGREQLAEKILATIRSFPEPFAKKVVAVRITELVLPKRYLDALENVENTRRENERLKREMERQLKEAQERQNNR